MQLLEFLQYGRYFLRINNSLKLDITLGSQFNLDHFEAHFYKLKLQFAGVYYVFHFYQFLIFLNTFFVLNVVSFRLFRIQKSIQMEQNVIVLINTVLMVIKRNVRFS